MPRTATILVALLALLVLPAFAAPIPFRRAEVDALRPRDHSSVAPGLSLRQIGTIIFGARTAAPSPEPTIVARSPAPVASVKPTVAVRDIGSSLINKLEKRAGFVPPLAARAVADTGKPTISLRELGSTLLEKVERRAGFVPPQAPRSPEPVTPTISLREVGSTFIEKLERRAGYIPPQARRSLDTAVDTPKAAEKPRDIPAARSIIAADKWCVLLSLRLSGWCIN